MTLVVCDDDAWFAAFGVVLQVEEQTGDDLVKEVLLPISESEELHVTWDVSDSSVRLPYRAAVVVVNVFRKQATMLSIDAQGDRRAVVVEWRMPGGAGRSTAQVRPVFTLEDSFLRA